MRRGIGNRSSRPAKKNSAIQLPGAKSVPLAGNNQVAHQGIVDSLPKTALRPVRRRYQFQQFQRLVNLEPELGDHPAGLLTVSQAFPAGMSLTHSPETRLHPRKLLPFTPTAEGPAVQGAAAMLAPESSGAVQANGTSAEDDPAGMSWGFKGSDADVGPIVESDHGAQEEPELDDDPFYDSPLNLRDYATSPSRRSWRAMRRLLSSRRFSQAMATAVLLLFVSTLDVPWRDWFSSEMQAAREAVEKAVATVTRPIKERAAFFIVEDFQKGADGWVNPTAIRVEQPGMISVDGLALHGETLNLESYRLDFIAKIQSKALGWVVRAHDTDNYYAFKLVESGKRSARSYHLERYTVVGGNREGSSDSPRIPVPSNLTQTGDFNRVSVRVRDQQITTLINGYGVDFFRDSQLPRGGVGFLSDKGEEALVSRVTVSGNEDTWGLLLYGTLETVRSIHDTISPRLAFALPPAPINVPRR